MHGRMVAIVIGVVIGFPAWAAPDSPAVVQAPPGRAPPPPGELTRPRQPFSLYGERRPGQLLFGLGVVGDFVGNIRPGPSPGARTGSFRARSS